MTTLASAIVTFNRPEHLRRSIKVLQEQTRRPDLILVVDNGTGDAAEKIVRETDDPAVVYEATGGNLGSAGGVAYGMLSLAARNFDWLHMVDDDNPPLTNDTVERLLALIDRNGDDDTLAAVAVGGSRWDWKKGEHIRIPDDALVGDVPVDTIGGSSQLTARRSIVEDVGPPDHRLFFGFYDPLWCLKLRKAGYRLLVDGKLHLHARQRWNKLGYEYPHDAIPRADYHAIWRRYYVTRNYVHEMRRTFHRPDLARREARKALARSVASWARGPRYGARFTRLQLRGVADGYRDRLGRTVEPNPKHS